MTEKDQTEPVVKRLKQWMDKLKLNAYQLSLQLGHESQEKISRLFRKGGAKPSYDILLDIANKFDNLDMNWIITGEGEMMKKKLSKNDLAVREVETNYKHNSHTYSPPKVVVTDDKGKEAIIAIDSKAAAGFPRHINDVDYYRNLPTLKLPNIKSTDATYICVQISGHSMSPTYEDKEWIVGKFEPDAFNNVRDGTLCLVVTADGVIFKRVFFDRKKGEIDCVCDNPQYDNLNFPAKEVLQIYTFVCNLNFKASDVRIDPTRDMISINKRLLKVEQQIRDIL